MGQLLIRPEGNWCDSHRVLSRHPPRDFGIHSAASLRVQKSHTNYLKFSPGMLTVAKLIELLKWNSFYRNVRDVKYKRRNPPDMSGGFLM